MSDDRLRLIGDDQAAEALRRLVSGRSVTFGPRPGHMYEVEIGYPEEALLDWDGSVMPAGHAVSEAGWGRGINKGRDLWLAAARDMGPLEASLHFSRGGIPGIRYLDQGSRAVGGGTRNYAMFPGTEDRIRILRQYGLLPPLAGGLALQEE